MLLRLQPLLSALTSVAAVAYALGWLKSYYFFRALGVNLDLASTLAWAVSAAKHFGSFDALTCLTAPDQYFSTVRVKASPDLADWDESRALYFLRKTDSNYLRLDLSRLRDKQETGLVVLPLDQVRSLEGSMRTQVQAGNRWF